MIVPVFIKYNDIEGLCYYDEWERGIICDDYSGEIEISAEEAFFERFDIEEIVNIYLDDILDVILNDKRYRETLFKKLKR